MTSAPNSKRLISRRYRGVVTWKDGSIDTTDSIEVTRPLIGSALRDSYLEAVGALTLGLARFRNNAVSVGPVAMLRFGEPRVGPNYVEWPIEGGLLARGGGTWRIEDKSGRVTATALGHRPALPRLVYDLSHRHVHTLLTHLYLLRLRGREPLPGREASNEDRVRAAAVDVAFCLSLAGVTGLRRPRRTLMLMAAYHVACWSLFGRTLGGLVLRERVVAVDGSRLTPTQSLMRFALLPVAWLARRPVHDEIAGTTVIHG